MVYSGVVNYEVGLEGMFILTQIIADCYICENEVNADLDRVTMFRLRA